jgi:hypothetical protein
VVGHMSEDWDNLLVLLSEVELSEDRDEVFWAPERTNKYS